MVTIKIKKEAIQPLIDAGLFDQWLANFKEQWKTDKNLSGNGRTIDFLELCTTPYELIT